MLRKKFIISILGFYVFWLCILPLLVSSAVKLFCDKYSQNSKYYIEIVEPKVKFYFYPLGKISAKQIVFKTDANSYSLKIDSPLLTIRLLPILSGKVHINNFEAENLNMDIYLKEKISLDKNIFNKLKKANFKIDSIKLDKYKFNIYQAAIEKPIEYDGDGLIFEKKNSYLQYRNNSSLIYADKISKFSTDLYLPKNNRVEKTLFNIAMDNVDISQFRNYLKNYIPSDIKDLQGIVSIKSDRDNLILNLSRIRIEFNDSAKSIVFPENMVIKSSFKVDRNSILFENIDIDSKNISLSIDGKIRNFLGELKPFVDFSVRLNKSKVEDIVNLLPSFKVEEIDVYKLKKYKFYGDALANLTIRGSLPEPEVFGDVYIDNGILIKPIPNTTRGANIKLDFTGKQVEFDVKVPAGGQEKVWVKGNQELYNIKYAKLTVQSTDSVDLKIAQNVVNPLHEILNFIIGPVPIMDINGEGNIDILVKGNRKTPHVFGVFNVKNGEISFNDFSDIKANSIEAVLTFNDEKANFITKKGLLNGKECSIKGSCDLNGKFDFDLYSQKQPIEALYKAILNSKLISKSEIKIPDVEKITGLLDLNLKIFGKVKYIEDLEFNKNVFAKGDIKLINNYIKNNGIEIKNINGVLRLDSLNFDTNLSATIADAPLNLNAMVRNNLANMSFEIPTINPNFLIQDNKLSEKQYLPFIKVLGKYKEGPIDKVDFSKLDIKATILSSNPASKIKFTSNGVIEILNNKVLLKNIQGYIDNKSNVFNANLIINDAFSPRPDANGKIKINLPDLVLINDFINSDLLSNKISEKIEFTKGSLSFDANIIKNKLNLNTDLSGVSFVYLPLNLPVDIVNGYLNIKNNNLIINKLNLLADSMPLLIDGKVRDIFGKKNFDLYLNSKPQQEFIDKYINKNQIYPIKIKGDILYWIKAKGAIENFDLKAQIDMSKNSSIYHFGATIGDIENAIKVAIESKILNRSFHKIKEFSYDKMIDSQSGRQTQLNLLKAWGGVTVRENDLIFDNLHIKTSHPTDARIFNIIFRKPNIKQGQFTSDLKINGAMSNPRVIGDFHIFETNIPFLDTQMKNIVLVFKDKNVEFNSKGEIMNNGITFEGILKNKLTSPYRIEKAVLYTKNMDLNEIVNKLKVAEVDNVSTFESLEGFDLASIVAKSFILKADNIKLRNIHATDFSAETSLSEKGVFDVNNFRFNIAQGVLNGKYSYNLKNNDINLSLKAESINANDITWALFDLNNQIYGDLTGDISLTCNGKDFSHCMETLSGNTVFNVKDGRMPKLGSLEYLLKAGNLVKGGLTGLSINSVVDLLAPSKTGDFSDIFGTVRIKDGIARNIEITTKGDDLSLFIGGTYNFATSIADMEILGLLSRKISTLLGPIGNVSINTLFNVIPGVDLSKDSLILERINRIPGVELSSKAYRKFVAIVKGNINGEDYVTSFKWIN